MSFTRTATALAGVALALGGLSACNGDDNKGGRETSAAAPSSSTAAASVPSPQELTDILNRASDPAVPTDQKLNLVQGGAEAPELFDEIARLKTENNATIDITGVARGDYPGVAIGNAVIHQADQQDINVQAQFVQVDGQWQLEKNFACALITNAGLQAPPTCGAAGEAPLHSPDGSPAEGEAPAPAPEQAPEQPAN